MKDTWSTWRRLTLAGPVEMSGIGLHSGEDAVVRVVPGGLGSGVHLVRVDEELGAFGMLRPEMVVPGPLCTVLKNEAGVTVSTVEHLLAALAGLGVTDVVIEIEGGEVPIVDGSARPWVEAILTAGVVETGAWDGAADGEVELEAGNSRLRWVGGKAGALAVRVEVAYAHPLIGEQVWEGEITPRVFMDEISFARSFILEKELALARAAGLVKGASLATGMLFGDDGKVANPEGLRFADEPVRHKVLDAIGDLALMGGRVPWGRYEMVRPGHAVNNGLLRKMMAV